MVGCLPLSQWLSTPARSLMFDPTRSQSPDHTVSASLAAAAVSLTLLFLRSAAVQGHATSLHDI